MKVFRVRNPGEVEAYLDFVAMDGKRYVPVGGWALPYITVSEALATLCDGARITRCSLQLDPPRKLILVPEDPESSELALVLVPPSSRFSYNGLRADQVAVKPTDDKLVFVAVMRPGETIRAYPLARPAPGEVAGEMCISYDGESVTCS